MSENHPHNDLIKRLGGASKLARELHELTGEPIKRENIVHWQKRGIAHRWRPALVRLAGMKRKKALIPADFIIDGKEAA